MILRDYQKKAVGDLRRLIKSGSSIPVLGMPTGSGKTVTFAYIIDKALQKGSRVGIVAHRKELLDQARRTILAYGLDPYKIHFGMVQTYVRSPHKIPCMDLCIVDECHIGKFRRFIDLLPSYTLVVGVTATPIGASKKKPLNKTFDGVIYSIQIKELIEMGFLSKPTYHIWEVDESKLLKDTKGDFTSASQSSVFCIDDLIDAVNRRVGKTIIFCSSIEQSQNVFNAIEGDKKFIVHSKMKYKDRNDRISMYKNIPNAIMVNCGILTAGFDDPDIKTVIVYRATTSLSLWLQMVGRGSRVTSDKKDFFIFDLGGNRERLLPWEVNRDWEVIFKNQGKSNKEKAAPLKKCPECEAQIAASARTCKFCNAEQKVKEKKELVSDKVKVISAYSDLPVHLKKSYDEMTPKELVERAAFGSPGLGRPFKMGWVINKIKKLKDPQEGIFELARIKGYKRGWVDRQLQGFNTNL